MTHSSKAIRQFANNNYRPLLVMSVVFLIYFIPYLGNVYVGIDTLYYINYPGTPYNWLEIGRQGGVLIHRLFFQSQFSMFFAEGMALLVYLLAGAVFAYLLHGLAAVPVWRSVLFFLFVMIHPIWAEQFYFTMQIFEIAAGVLLVGLALCLAYGDRWYYWAASIILQVWAFSVYQTFVVVYIAGCILCFLLRYIHEVNCDEGRTTVQYVKHASRQFLLFLIAFFVNMVITKLFFTSSDYLTGQVRWGSDPASVCLERILSHMRQVTAGDGIFYNHAFLVFGGLTVVLATLFVWQHRKGQQGKSIFLLAVLVLQLSPFLLTIYGGSIPVFRSQYIIPFTIACDVLLALSLVPPLKWPCRSLLCALAVFILVGQYYETSQLQYTHFFERQEDERRAFSIEEKIIETTNGANKPVAFIGYFPARTNGAYVKGELVQQSIFSFAIWGEPRYKEMTGWNTEYMNSLGINISRASTEQIQEAQHIANQIPAWPLEGSVRDAGDFVVVKLSADDYYASESMLPAATQEGRDLMLCANDRLRADIGEVSVDGNILMISGWVLQPGLNSNYAVPGVNLWDESTNTLYSLASGSQYREDLTNAFADGTDYSHSGVLAKAPLDQLPISLERCRIILSVTTANGDVQYFDTGAYVQQRLES